AEGRRRHAGPVRGDGDGEAGGRGAELLVRRRRLLLLLDGRGDGRRGVAARVLCRAVAPGLGGAGTGDRGRDGVPGRPAPAAPGAQRTAVQLAGRGGALLRDVRADLGAAGV